MSKFKIPPIQIFKWKSKSSNGIKTNWELTIHHLTSGLHQIQLYQRYPDGAMWYMLLSMDELKRLANTISNINNIKPHIRSGFKRVKIL